MTLHSEPAPLDLSQIQGIVMRGYRYWFVRYVQLKVQDAAAACTFIGGLIDPKSGLPQVQFATDWGPVKPKFCFNVAVTYPGLKALGIPPATDASLQASDYLPFVQGSAAHNVLVGDLGQSDPSGWRFSDRTFDVVLVMWADGMPLIESLTASLQAAYGDAFTEVTYVDSQDLKDNRIYFDYRDGIAQPTLIGNPTKQGPDGGQALVDPAAFVLGQSRDSDPNGYYKQMQLPAPSEQFAFGSFGVLRMLRQDVESFDAFVAASTPQVKADYGLPNDLVASKAVKALVIGRWPDGAALAQYPITSELTDEPPAPESTINDFEYGPDRGVKCPFTSHLRRGNPRDDGAQGAVVKNSRIMRRAMPYQDPLCADRNDPSTERGLLGFFLSASLQQGFEIVMPDWINGGATGALDAADPAIGYDIAADQGTPPQPNAGYTLTYKPPKSPPKRLQIPKPFVTTRGSAYVYLPGRPGIAWLASLTT